MKSLSGINFSLQHLQTKQSFQTSDYKHKTIAEIQTFIHKKHTMIFDPTQVNKLHIRQTEFFSSSIKFKQFTDDVEKTRMTDITDVQIECLGYGHFNKPKVLANFFTYLRGVITFCKHIKTLKIELHGFDLPQQKIIPKICSDIIKNIKQNIKTLWFHTGQLSNCTLQDFESMLSLATELSHINFQDLSLQFSRWQFTKCQPNVNDIEQVFGRMFKNAQMTKINNQRFRLEMSAWYYDFCSAKSFLRFKCSQKEIIKNFALKDGQELQRRKIDDKEFGRRVSFLEDGQFVQEALLPLKVQEFHRKIQNMIRTLLQMMDHVKEFEIDFRNWNDVLKMKGLKKKLDNITKKDTYEKSIVSKRIGLEDHQNQIQLRMVFVM